MDFQKIREQSEAIIKQLEDDNKKAVQNKTLVGRYISVSVADGDAYYRCIKETKTTVILEWVPGIYDEYSDWNLGRGTSSMLKKKFRAMTDLYASLDSAMGR